MRARVPASTSNLGPGFDVLGLALALYTEVEIRPAERLMIHTEGEGSEFAADSSHLAARIAAAVVGHDRLQITVSSQIPPGRGLGSSAALAVAAAAAAGASDPLAVAARSDGHAENSAASVLGGLVAATFVGGEVVARRLPLDPAIVLVLLVPERRLETAAARVVLPPEVPFADAVFNLGRLGLLVAGLGRAEELIAAAGEDRLHQEQRRALFPESDELLAALRAAGAVISCWSGAGPSLLAVCTSSLLAAKVRDAGEDALTRVGLVGQSVLVRPDLQGLLVTAS